MAFLTVVDSAGTQEDTAADLQEILLSQWKENLQISKRR